MCEAVEKYAEKRAEKESAKAELRVRIESIRNLMKNLKLTAEQAMEYIGIPKSEYSKYMNLL